nr:hypothetical protein [uncultured Desulfobacter sp.]
MPNQKMDNGDYIDLAHADMFEEGKTDNLNKSMATGTSDGHERLFRTPQGRFVLQSWVGHRRPQSWVEITRDQAVEWLERNEWKPQTATYGGSQIGRKTFTRTVDETKAEFERRVNKAVLELQRK